MKIGILFPFQDMIDVARPIVEETEAEVVYMKVISSAEAVSEARKAIEAGAEMLISRGHYAALIKKYTKIPVIEIRLHTQEIGLLLKKTKSIIKKERPVVGLVTFENMLSDMSYMEALFDVDLRIAFISKIEEAAGCVETLKRAGADMIIGGQVTCQAANDQGLPALIYGTSAESIREAFREADRMAYVMEIEQRGNAQFETVLDTTFNGIIKIDANANITVINKLVENLIGKNMEDVIGHSLYTDFPEFDRQVVESILRGEAEHYTISVNIRRQAWALTLAPIQYNENITGAILSLQKLSENLRTDLKGQNRLYLDGYVAEKYFRHIHTRDEQMRVQLELARKYALSERPVLIYSEPGTEYLWIAEAIHNGSVRKNGPFISINMDAVTEQEQLQLLFGSTDQAGNEGRGAIMKAQHGTLFIKGIENMTMRVQHQLARTLMTRSFTGTDLQTMSSDYVRVIAVSGTNLALLMAQGRFSPELFYQIQGLVLNIPPIRQRREDLEDTFKIYFTSICKKYNKYLVMTDAAGEAVAGMEWPGNFLQLRTFCETLVLAADRRTIDEGQTRALYDLLYPQVRPHEGQQRMVVYRAPQADQIDALLEKYHGNRSRAAEELGISTTTLWRKMKKYGIEARYQD